MYFVLMPDGVASAHVKEILVKDYGTNVRVGTFSALLDQLNSAWLLPDLECDYQALLKQSALKAKHCFWSESIKVDELITIGQLEQSLSCLYSSLSLTEKLEPLESGNSRIERYYNDLVKLASSIDHTRPHSQMLAKTWLDNSSLPALHDVIPIYLPEMFQFECWQKQVLDKLNQLFQQDNCSEKIHEILKEQITDNFNQSKGLTQLSQSIFSVSDIKKIKQQDGLSLISARDALEEMELVVAAIQNALNNNISIEDIAVVIPVNSRYENLLPLLLNKAGINASHHHGSKRYFQWADQLIRDCAIFYHRTLYSRFPAEAMILGAIFVNPLMPWSVRKGQNLFDDFQRKGAQAFVDYADSSSSESKLLDLIIKPEKFSIITWLKSIAEALRFSADKRLPQKKDFLERIDSIDALLQIYTGKTDEEVLQSVISQIAPQAFSIQEEEGGYIKNGILIINEHEWLIKPVKHLFILGFNQGAFQPNKYMPGVFSEDGWKKISLEASLPVYEQIIDHTRFENCFSHMLSRAVDSITIMLSEQGFDGESISGSETLLDIALCFQLAQDVDPQLLLKRMVNDKTDFPFLVRSSNLKPVIVKDMDVVEDLNLGIDLLKLNKDANGNQRPESPSSLEKLMVSPLSWLLYRNGLQPKGWDVQDLNHTLKGTIAHKVFELHFNPEQQWSIGNFEEMFEAALLSEASYLLEPKWRMEKTQLKNEIIKSLKPFIEWCEKQSWEISLMEQRLQGKMFGIAVAGYVDAVFSNGKKALVLDYKKSKSDKFVTRLNKGFDLQTMIYRKLYKQEKTENIAIHSGYYTLNDQRLVLDYYKDTGLDDIEQVELETSSIKNQYEQAEKKIRQRIKQLKSGTVELNTEGDAKYWEDLGVSSLGYAIDDNPIIKQFIKPSEEVQGE